MPVWITSVYKMTTCIKLYPVVEREVTAGVRQPNILHVFFLEDDFSFKVPSGNTRTC